MKLEVIIIDDDEIITYMQKSLVEECGLASEPRTFADGKDALNFFKEQDPAGKAFLLLLDINMPEMSGWEFLDSIKTLSSYGMFDLYVIMVTSSVNSDDKRTALRYDEVIGFIEKPMDLAICAKIKEFPQISGYFE